MDETLFSTGEEVRNTSMNRRKSRERDLDDDHTASSTPSKKRRMSCNEDMNRKINDLEKAEQRRNKFQDRHEQCEITSFDLDPQRFGFEKTVHKRNKESLNRRLEMENRRMREQVKRETSIKLLNEETWFHLNVRLF